jgi:hypothetical protein
MTLPSPSRLGDPFFGGIAPTPSERARYARAELEVIAAALGVHELARLVDLGRKLLDNGG